MAMAQGSISKTKKDEPQDDWEVTGRFNFSSEGTLLSVVATRVYVSASSAADAARKAIDKMGLNAEVKKVVQLFPDKDERNDE